MKHALVAALLTAAMPSLAGADFDSAKFLEERCSSCHDERVYTRPNRRVGNLPQLESQVRRCDANLGTGLFEDDITSLVKHLDRHYYRFGQ